MAVQRVADMTVEELQRMIQETVERQMRQWVNPHDNRTLEEVLESIDRHVWTPPPGTPSTLELLREDRDR